MSFAFHTFLFLFFFYLTELYVAHLNFNTWRPFGTSPDRDPAPAPVETLHMFCLLAQSVILKAATVHGAGDTTPGTADADDV